jgi:hypothetical protein
MLFAKNGTFFLFVCLFLETKTSFLSPSFQHRSIQSEILECLEATLLKSKVPKNEEKNPKI